jgi:Fe-S-cluster-containing dehydrogenase component/anaerobic selenocysteine-containing dehydrogenase
MPDESPKRYWLSLPQRDADSPPAAGDEFPEPPPSGAGPDRRTFLRAAGFAFAGTMIAGCGGGPLPRAPVQRALAHTQQPEGLTPGRACDYASTCAACTAGCGLLVKTRDGRPIKLEGNPEHPLSGGGLCAVGQASLLGLYDRLRLEQLPHPLRHGQPSTWAQVDREIGERLAQLPRGKSVRVLSGTITSPTTRALIQQFLRRFPDGRHVIYDPLSCSAILDAHQRTHGARVLPHYHFDRAEVIVSFDADFLGTWIAPVEFAAGYRAGRSLEGNPPRLSYHVQFESRMSLTGARADWRVRVAPGELGLVMTHLARTLIELARRRGRRIGWAGAPFETAGIEPSPVTTAQLEQLAKRLLQARRSLIVCGSQDVNLQILCNFLNHLLGNYEGLPTLGASTVGLLGAPLGQGPLLTATALLPATASDGATVDIARPSLQRQGNDAEMQRLLADLRSGSVGALFILDCNPVYDLPGGEELVNLLRRGDRLVVCCSQRLDETAAAAHYVCPHPDYLASWGDAEPVRGVFSLAQPTVRPLAGEDTRPILESLAAWLGMASPGSAATIVGLLGSPLGQGPVLAASAAATSWTAYALLQEFWRRELFPRQTRVRDFQTFWDLAVRDGHVELAPPRGEAGSFTLPAGAAILRATRPAAQTYDLVLYPKVGLLDGRHAYNPWLQELPDPISKVTWDNYACLSPTTAARLGVSDGDVIRLEGEGTRGLELPALVQPGQHDGVIAVALGYGSKASERFAGIGPRWLEARPTVDADGRVGVNAAPLLAWEGGTLRYWRGAVRLTRTGRHHPLASTQLHHTITVPARLAPPGQQRRPLIRETTPDGLAGGWQAEPAPAHGEHADLWPEDHPVTGPRWGMVIDLHVCTGCSACVVACQVENNVPIVGKDEVRRAREMHWLRIDRYYAGEGGDVDVFFQPMLCQHCGNAPCETVCPVLATVHSAEGLNQQVYNRCVGTRYCANNCPYKVRRFNWFDYPHEDALQNLVLNPDVAVRSRGVMEKCSFCVQRIQDAKLEARRRGEDLEDGAVQTACQQSCPAGAIVFGDLNDPESEVSRRMRDPRRYRVLAELNVRPAVGYLGLVRNRPLTLPSPPGG